MLNKTELAPLLPSVIRWADYPRDEWPYPTPERQWLESATELTVAELWKFWDGVAGVTVKDIELLVNSSGAQTARARFHFDALASQELPDYAGRIGRMAWISNELARIDRRIGAIEQRTASGTEQVAVSALEVTQTLSNRSFGRLQRTYIDLVNLRQDLVNELERLQGVDKGHAVTVADADAGISKVQKWQQERQQATSSMTIINMTQVNVNQAPTNGTSPAPAPGSNPNMPPALPPPPTSRIITSS